MKKSVFIEKSPFESNVFYLIPLPSEKSFGKLIDMFNKNRKAISGIVKIDMIIFTGNRKGRFISAKINQGVIDVNSYTLIDKDESLEQLTNEVYAKLPDVYLNKIYPLDFRKKIKSIKEGKHSF
jgi:hypothetical protein